LNVALITARGGSKGLPGKNILPMCGLPLIGWSIKAALDCIEIDNCFVSSDDKSILDVSGELGAVPLKRPLEFAMDSSSSEDVIKHFLKEMQNIDALPEVVALLQPTSPLRTAQHLTAAFDVFMRSKANCVVSVFEPKHSPVKAYALNAVGELEGLYGKEAPYQPRQELPRAFQPNGAIYIFSVKAFIAENGIPKTEVYPYIMSESESVDIDDQQDFDLAESLLRKRHETRI
jgi:N-acylneuraminate cytidylyltransferase